MEYLTEPLASTHKKKDFLCGKSSLDNYLKTQANQDMKRKLCAVFVMTNKQKPQDILGYYTLSSESINSEQVPFEISKKMPPSYTRLPVILLGRLAISQGHHGQGLGKKLLVDALRRSVEITRTLGAIAVIVDPLDEEAKAFYEQYGFILIPDRGCMFLPMATIQQLF
jgi:predicted GNAT family N-acyltransferase